MCDELDPQTLRAGSRDIEQQKQRALSLLPVSKSTHTHADLTGLSPQLCEIAPSLLFSSAIMVLDLVCLGFLDHSMKPETTAKAVLPDETERGVDWIRVYSAKHGTPPAIATVESEFALSRSTAYRRIRATR
jgi:hypothetical protein